MPRPNEPAHDYDVWSIVCLLCGEILDQDGERPPLGVMARHTKDAHGIDYAEMFPAKEGYGHSKEVDESGYERYTSSSIHATDNGEGAYVIVAVRSWGYQGKVPSVSEPF